jgi:hypothetical protein
MLSVKRFGCPQCLFLQKQKARVAKEVGQECYCSYLYLRHLRGGFTPGKATANVLRIQTKVRITK